MIYGIGITDIECCSHLKSYKAWQRLLARCYGKLKTWKHYHDCEVCEEWKRYSSFKEWYDLNYRHDLEEKGIELDLTKSAFKKDCKVFGPETCVFLPRKVVLFLLKKRKTNTSGVTGIYKSKDKYKSQINEFGEGKTKKLGTFNTLKEAKSVYKEEKERQINKMLSYLRELDYSEDIISKIEERAKGSGLMEEKDYLDGFEEFKQCRFCKNYDPHVAAMVSWSCENRNSSSSTGLCDEFKLCEEVLGLFRELKG